MKLIEQRLAENEYLCGNEISIADLSAGCELDQIKFLGTDLATWPLAEKWLHKIIDENPPVLELHKTMRHFAAKSLEKMTNRQ